MLCLYSDVLLTELQNHLRYEESRQQQGLYYNLRTCSWL